MSIINSFWFSYLFFSEYFMKLVEIRLNKYRDLNNLKITFNKKCCILNDEDLRYNYYYLIKMIFYYILDYSYFGQLNNLLKNTNLINLGITIEINKSIYDYTIFIDSTGKIIAESLKIDKEIWFEVDRTEDVIVPILSDKLLKDKEYAFDKIRLMNTIDLITYTHYINEQEPLVIYGSKIFNDAIKNIKILSLNDEEERGNILQKLMGNYYSKNILKTCMNLIPYYFNDIIEVTSDWRFITNYDKEGYISLYQHGSGLATVMLLLPELLKAYNEDYILICPWTSNSLHPILEKELLKLICNENIKGQFIFDSNLVDELDNNQIGKTLIYSN